MFDNGAQQIWPTHLWRELGLQFTPKTRRTRTQSCDIELFDDETRRRDYGFRFGIVIVVQQRRRALRFDAISQFELE